MQYLPSKNQSFYFRGAWTEEEKALVAAALPPQHAETPSLTDQILGKPWVCVKKASSAGTRYFAQHFRSSKVLNATSAQELARQLSAFEASEEEKTIADLI